MFEPELMQQIRDRFCHVDHCPYQLKGNELFATDPIDVFKHEVEFAASSESLAQLNDVRLLQRSKHSQFSLSSSSYILVF